MKKIALAACLLAVASPAYAMTYYLVEQWTTGQGHFCKYGNGAVMNVGIKICPLSIQG